ncbi:hypothetical protein SCP_0606790 [Sparassis crispa]|uniref:Uncharacterized protein n=1 Tax=Sparassis crispa TaxID=139825 RepID=A0A401GRA5_9APHY|nr:hypothetical protein SCP_0606790 [Sparassis crispa]GBE84699.1 hypothetical protein SCP_0606790 [Sparassis crispa]
MDALCDDALSGKLTAESLQRYLQPDRSIINKYGGTRNLTPLAAASLHGHLDIVELLLDNFANPNAVSANNRTPLFYVTSRKVPRDQLAIVRALLHGNAKVDECYDNDGRNTPLMNAIQQLRDKDIVHELVDRGASLTLRNSKGKTAEDLAKEYDMLQDVRPYANRKTSWAEVIDLLVAVVMFVIAVVNGGSIEDASKGVIAKLYNITGEKNKGPADDTVAKGIATLQTKEMKTTEDLQNNLTSYVSDTGLDQFFKPGDTFLQDLAKKAASLPDDPNSLYSKPDNVKRLTTLSLYQPVIYCDDSGSMDSDNRYENQRELVSRIARIATRIVPETYGVELRFINADSASNLSAAEIDAAMRRVEPDGGTMLGTSLRSKILEPLVYGVIASGKKLDRPFLICTITDGDPSRGDRPSFKDAIVECRKMLVRNGYKPNAVRFCVSQIGNDRSATAFLEQLRGDPEISDVLYCTSDRLDDRFKEFKQAENRLEEWLLKMLTEPIMNRE